MRKMIKISVIIPVYNVEHYIEETLRSIQEQTFMDYEVIIVNDGSTDNSQNVIDAFCKEDNRFTGYVKENDGVSMARNYGLDRARGEYVFFVDGDDIIPQKTMEIMYRYAKEKNADMVIGAMQEFGIYGKPVYKATKDLAKKGIIDRYDVGILWTFSVCNKLLRKSVIDRLNLRFEKIKHAEDGLFLFHYLYNCETICGCNGNVVYQYRRRPFWEERSATQAASMGHLTDLLYALEEIIKLAEKQREIEIKTAENFNNNEMLYLTETRCFFDNYLSKLHQRILSASLINGYYRQIWKADNGVMDLVKQSIEKYRRGVFPSVWDGIVKANHDLRLEQGILTKDELIESPLITVAISDQISEKYVNGVIESIFNQKMPAVVIHIHGKHSGIIEKDYSDKENIFLHDQQLCTADFKNEVIYGANSPYIYFVDEPMYVNVDTFLYMYNWMETHQEYDFCGARICNIVEGEMISPCKPHDVGFYPQYTKNPRNIFRSIDWMMSNKLFRTNTLKSGKIQLQGTSVVDIENCFALLKYKTLGDIFVFSELTEKDILDNTTSIKAKMFWKYCYRKVERKSKAYITRKDRERKKRKYAIRMYAKKFLIRIMPIRKKVLFVSVRGNELLENMKAVYDVYDGKKVVFTKRYPHSFRDKLRLYMHLFSSKVIVTDDYLKYFRAFTLKPSQKIIQIWHACGAFKKFGLDYASADISRELEVHRQYDTVTVSSEFVRDKYAGAFGIDVEKVKALGVPRTDKLLDKSYIEREREIFFKKHPHYSDKKIILYAPTFREEGLKRVVFNPMLEWKDVSQQLGTETVLLIKNHPNMKYDLLKGQKFDNIFNVKDEDTSRLMIVCDVMITDYSSVIFEAALLNKPTVFYCPDFESYERDFYLKFPDDLYGELTKNQTELLAAINRALDKPDMLKLENFKKMYMGSCDGHSAQRVAELIAQKLNEI